MSEPSRRRIWFTGFFMFSTIFLGAGLIAEHLEKELGPQGPADPFSDWFHTFQTISIIAGLPAFVFFFGAVYHLVLFLKDLSFHGADLFVGFARNRRRNSIMIALVIILVGLSLIFFQYQDWIKELVLKG